jgi:chlorophyllide a hydrolase
MSTASVKIEPREELAKTRGGWGDKQFKSVNGALALYWLFCAAIGLLLLRDEIFSWKVPAAWGVAPVFFAYALLITLFNEWAYIQVARHDGRPFNLTATILFTVINGVLEVFAFMGAFRLLEGGSRLLLGESWAVLNFTLGFIGFVVYSGISHAFFWARVLPRHFSADPAVQPLRKALNLIQAAIVLGWCLYFFATNDLWTLVFLHIIIDAVLMWRVRPLVLGAK